MGGWAGWSRSFGLGSFGLEWGVIAFGAGGRHVRGDRISLSLFPTAGGEVVSDGDGGVECWRLQGTGRMWALHTATLCVAAALHDPAHPQPTPRRHEKIGDVQGRGLTPVQVRTLTRALKGIKVTRGRAGVSGGWGLEWGAVGWCLVSERCRQAGCVAAHGRLLNSFLPGLPSHRKPHPTTAPHHPPPAPTPTPTSSPPATMEQVVAKHNKFKKAIRSVCRGSPFEARPSSRPA